MVIRAIRPLVLAVSFVITGTAACYAQAQNTGPRNLASYGGFEGRWEGVLRFTPSQVFNPQSVIPSPDPSDASKVPEPNLAFSITKDAAKVYQKSNNNWTEIKAGSFRIVSGATNAILFAITAGTDSDGGWVETWNYTITHKERDTIYVVKTRAVNNYNKPADYLEKRDGGTAVGRFFSISYGEMTLVDSPAK